MLTRPTVRPTLALISTLALVTGLAAGPAAAAPPPSSVNLTGASPALAGMPPAPAVTSPTMATAATVPVGHPATSTSTSDGGRVDVYSGLPGHDGAATGSPSGDTTTSQSGVDPAVRAAVADGPAPVIVRLHEQVDRARLARDAAEAGRVAASATSARLRGQGVTAHLDELVSGAAREARGALVVDTLRATAQQTQRDVRELLDGQEAAGRASDIQDFWIFNGFAVTVDGTALDALAAHPDVASVTLDATIVLDEPVPTDPGEPLLPAWSLERVNAPDVWGEYGTRGGDVVVGVMDSGVDASHPALASSWRGRHGDPEASWFVPTGENYPTPGDGHGHGTHVTGSIVGAPPGEVTGVAPEAQWIAAKIFTDFGSTTDSILHAAFEWMLAPGGDPAAAPHVVNNSWGSNATHRTEFWDAVAAWVAAGIVPVFANGNSGPGTGTVGSPASFPHAIGVGATDAEDRVAWFSSRGPVVWNGVEHTKPQISAPGYEVRSTWPTHLSGDGYQTISGTSMATPHVTGVVALLLSAAPGLSVDEVREALETTARTSPHMEALPQAYGAGVVDAYRAVTHVAHSGLVTGVVAGPSGDPVEATVAAGDLHTTSDPHTGAYELRLPAGAHEVTVTAYGFAPQAHPVDVAVGGTIRLDLTLAATSEQILSGTVAGPDGPVPGARVSLPGTPVPAGRSDDAGAFQFEVAAGVYDLQVTAGGYEPVVLELVVDKHMNVMIGLIPAVDASAPGWAQYQNNPARTGRSGDSLAAETLEPGWSAPSGGSIVFSSPVIADGRVFVNTDQGALTAMNLTSGERLWTFETSTGLRGAPAVADGVVYTGGGVDGGIHAVDAATGESVWTLATPGRRTIYTAPVVRAGVVYATTGFTPDATDTLFAIDAATGSVVWSVDLGPRVFFGPAVGEGIVVAASAGDRRLVALDAMTGAELWALEREQDEFIAGPSIAVGAVYVTTSVPPVGFAPGWQGSLLAVDAGTGSIIWEAPTHGDGQGTSPAVLGDLVIAGSHGLGVVAAYDRATGAPAWHYGLATSGGVSASILVSGDGYVVGGSQGDRRVFALDAATGELVWEHPVNANVLASAAYAEGWLVTATSNGTVHAFHPTGQLRGVVTGPDGPLPATVRVVEADQEVTAAADTGAFEVPGLLPGEYTVEVSHYGFGPHTRTVTVLVAQATALEVALDPVGDGALTGVVVDEAGQPLAGATVTLVDTPLAAGVTGGDGGYAFGEVAAGTYRVVVMASGYSRAETTVTITAGQTAMADFTLARFDVAVVADYEGRVADVLAGHGWRVDRLSFDQVSGTLDRYRAVVVAGQGTDRADADLDRFAQLVAEADAAGTSLVFLDTGGPSYGSVRTLSQVTGDPAAAPAELSNRGSVWLEDVVDHPVTASLPDADRVPLLAGGSWHAWFTGYTGHTLATLGNDRDGRRGGGVGYQRRTMASNHILLPAAAPSPWSTWEPGLGDLLAGAVDHAVHAAYGTVTGQVTDAAGDPVAAAIEVAGDLAATVAGPDGGYELLVEPGEQVLRFRSVGAQTVELPVVVSGGQVHVRDVTLLDSPLGTVTGVVTQQDGGTPVAGATITVVGATLPAATTGPGGGYVIEDVPGGTYDVEVSADGYEPRTVAGVEVVDGDVTTLDVTLARAPGVVVVGDRLNQISDFLESRSIPAEQAGWEIVDDLDGVEVVILHNPPSIGQEEFLAALAAFDDAGVSVIFPADGWNTRTRGFDLLVNHTGNPPSYGRLGGISGPEIYLHNLVDHPLFAGIDGDSVQLLTASSEAAFFPGYAGIRLADVALVDQEPAGIGIAYDVRTPRSVHVLLSGLAATLRNHPEGNWTPDGQRIFLNAVRWAAAPGQGGVSGTVTDPAGEPIADAVVEVAGSHWRAVTDSNGAFEVGVPPGEHTLHYRAFGYVPAARTVTVSADEVADASVSLAVGDVGAITGVVSSSEGGPLAEVRVDLLGTPYQTVTTADGSYAFSLVEPGSYELEVEVETGGHVRTLVPVEVVADQTTQRDVALRVSPRIGIIDDSDFSNSRDRGKEFLADWGYEAEDIGFDSLDRIGDLDLVVANVSDFNLDPGFESFKAFEEEVNRAGVPVLWMAQHGRGAIQFLHDYDGTPAVTGEGFSQGAVTATAVADHALLAGLPDEFPLMTDNGRFTFFDEFEGTTVATLSTGSGGELGATIAYRGRTAGTVDVLLSTLSVTTWGAPATRQSPAVNWTPEAERVFVNALDWALDAQGLSAEVLGTVDSDRGGRLASQVEVVETSRTYTGRDGDGTFLVPLPPGTWTLSVGAFGHADQTFPVTVEAGDVATPHLTLAALPSGTVAGTITGPDGDAVPGAEVRLLDTPLSTGTGPDGSYSIGQVPAGEWTLRVTADGFRARQVPVTVAAGQTTPVSVALPATSSIAVVDTTGSSTHGVSVANLLAGEGYEVDLVSRATLADLAGRIGDYELVVFNASLLSSNVEPFRQAVDAAAAAGVSTIHASQFGSGYPIVQLSTWRGDPVEADWGFVSIGIDYVPTAPHPIFAGFPTGEPIELITSTLSNLNQQWGSFSGYSGQTIAQVHTRVDGEDLGAGVGYQFTSPTSVEVLLGSLAAVTHGWPDERWTGHARQIYLNTVAWALDATQAELTGTVMSATGGVPVAGATVTALEAGATGVTGPDGSYSLGLTEGDHTIRVSAFGFHTAEHTVAVPETGTVTLDVDLVPLPRGEVSGAVSSTTGEPVAGATLTGTGPLGWSATTGPDGTYHAGDLLEGEYEVTVNAGGYLPAAATVTVDAASPAVLDLTLQPIDIGVLGDVDGALTAYLRQSGVPAGELAWDPEVDLSGYRVVVVNGGAPEAEVFDAVLAAADEAEASLVFTGTWAVDRGGIRLLERHTGRVTVGPQGYGDGPVRLAGFDPDHPLFTGLGADPATLIVEGGYYSLIESYTGAHGGWDLADLHVDRADAEPVTGLAVAWSWRTAGSVEVLLSASAVTEAVGPGLGWTEDGGRLLTNAIGWAGDAELAAPDAPTLAAAAPVVVEPGVTVGGVAEWPSQVTVWRDGAPVTTAVTAEDGTWSAQVPLAVGDNVLTAAATNLAGDSVPSEAVTVARWVPTWEITGGSAARVVRLSLDGPAPLVAPADRADLVLRDADGTEVFRGDLHWSVRLYLAAVIGLPPGDLRVSAELQIDGFVLVIEGPMLE
jgi:outer membrane protein assembly factor BamB/subtilisin family serine protease